MKNIILEIGVNTGQDVDRLLHYRGDYHGFEPVPELYNKLTQRYRNNERVKFYPHAVDIEEGPATFNISKPTGVAYAYGCSSLHDFSTNLDDVWPGREDFEVVEKITVERQGDAASHLQNIHLPVFFTGREEVRFRFPVGEKQQVRIVEVQRRRPVEQRAVQRFAEQGSARSGAGSQTVEVFRLHPGQRHIVEVGDARPMVVGKAEMAHQVGAGRMVALEHQRAIE